MELDYLDSGSLEDAKWRGLISLDAAYTYIPTFARVLKEYNREKHKPVFMVEANYEGEHDYTGPMTLRRQEYWTMLSGATGQFYGNRYTWQFLDEWQAHLNTVGSRQMTYVTNPWRNVAGSTWSPMTTTKRWSLGTARTRRTAPSRTSNYVAAARTPDGRLVIAYVPEAQTIGVDMRGSRGASAPVGTTQPTGRTSGSGVLGSTTPAPQFSPPAENADGDPDWVLVLTAT